MNMFKKISSLFGSKENEPEVNNETQQPQTTDAQAEAQEPQAEETAHEEKRQAEKPQAEKSKGSDEFGKSRIYNLIIVDESGSMNSLRQSTLSGINETLNTIRSAQKEFADTQEHYVTLVTFDTGRQRYPVRTIINCCPIEQVGEFTDYHPSGCTPLYDAMGNSIVQLESKIKNDPDASALVTVLTDGLENASREWDAKSVRLLIERLKEAGWTFSYLGSAHNVREVTDLLCIDNVMEFDHSVMGSANIWERERGSKMAYLRKMEAMARQERMSGVRMSAMEKREHKQKFAREYYSDRLTPHHVDMLREGEVFVFGSNPQGIHNGGAAQYAVRHFGAVMGQGEGPQGHCYAIPATGSYQELASAVDRFTDYAAQHPEQRFLVTAIGCGTAGRDLHDVAPLFIRCIHLENVTLPLEFWKVLGLNMNI